MSAAAIALTGRKWLAGVLLALALWLLARGVWAGSGLAMGPPFTLDARSLYTRAGSAIGAPFELKIPWGGEIGPGGRSSFSASGCGPARQWPATRRW